MIYFINIGGFSMYYRKRETHRILTIFMVVLMLVSTFLNIPVFAKNNVVSFEYDSYVV